jgi:replication-associated recombination protein RarA
MTEGAQQALRRTMELYSKTTRFALACNASDKIIEPIQSRCAMLRYSKLNDEQLLKRLIEISKAEQVSFTSEGLEAIIFTAQGDMRQVNYYYYFHLFILLKINSRQLIIFNQQYLDLVMLIVKMFLKSVMNHIQFLFVI